MAKLGWIGTGNMGTAMSLRLLEAGHELTVWARNKGKLALILEKGAREASSPAEVMRASEAVFLSVTDTAAVEELIFGREGLACGGSRGKLVIDHTTINPVRCREMAERLQAETGMSLVDAPVSGGPAIAREGNLTAVVGGTNEDVEQALPWIKAYAGKITHMGPSGAGQAAKSCNQAIFSTTMAVWAEVLNYAHRFGIDAGKMVEALGGGTAESSVRQQVVPRMVNADYPNTSTKLIMKDIDIVCEVAGETHSPMPITSLVTNLYRMLIAQGHDRVGPAGIMRLYSDQPLKQQDPENS